MISHIQNLKVKLKSSKDLFNETIKLSPNERFIRLYKNDEFIMVTTVKNFPFGEIVDIKVHTPIYPEKEVKEDTEDSLKLTKDEFREYLNNSYIQYTYCERIIVQTIIKGRTKKFILYPELIDEIISIDKNPEYFL